MKSLVPALLVVTVAVHVSPGSVQGQVAYNKIVDTHSVIPGQGVSFAGFDPPSLGDGYVGFRSLGTCVYTGAFTTRGGLHAAANANTEIPSGTGDFTLVFQGSFDGLNTAFTGLGNGGQAGVYSDAGGLHRVADLSTTIPNGTGNFTGFARPVIRAGNVAFVGSGASSQKGVYANAGGSLNVVADKTTAIPGGSENFTNFSDNLFSFDGQDAAFFGSGGGQAGFYAGHPGALRVVVDKNTPIPGGTGNFGTFAGVAADNGGVAFIAGDATGAGKGVYADLGGLTLVADMDTPAPEGLGNFTSFGTVSLDGTNLAFGAMSGWGALSGLYARYDGALIKIIDQNDLLDGKAVSYAAMSTEALDGNQLAFLAQFTDGSSAIYVATLPEPATLALLVLGGVICARRRRS